MTVFVAAVGDANDPSTWSGIPYHFTKAGQEAGLIDAGLPLSTTGPSWKAQRAVWNGLQLASRGTYGGFQFSERFLNRLWRQAPPLAAGDSVINLFPLFPQHIVSDERVAKWFFIDQTLRQLFDYYEVGSQVGRHVMQSALRREKENYLAATAIVTHSRWAMRSVVEDYGVSADKVVTIVPGANLNEAACEQWALSQHKEPPRDRDRDGRPLRLVFVGKYWRRKGLDRLIAAVGIARSRGAEVELTIIGFPRERAPVAVRDLPGLHWLGFIDKQTETRRFLDAVGPCDFGCLLSRAEAGGQVLREYHRLGLGVLASRTGGIPDFVVPEAAVLIEVDATDHEVAETIVRLARDRDTVERMRHVAASHSERMTWANCAAQFCQFMNTKRPVAA